MSRLPSSELRLLAYPVKTGLPVCSQLTPFVPILNVSLTALCRRGNFLCHITYSETMSCPTDTKTMYLL